MEIEIIIALFLVLTALWTVMARSLLRAAIGLALTSAMLTVMMYKLNAPLAAVFELSVCSGLISVIFITTISLTQPLTWAEIYEHERERLSRFRPLPFIILLLGLFFWLVKVDLALPTVVAEKVTDVRVVLWSLRQLDLVGQIICLLAGAFGVTILFKAWRGK